MTSRRPRVALVVEELRSTGGQERTALELARGLSTAWDVQVVAERIDPQELPAGVSWHPVACPARPAAWRFRGFVRGARQAARALRPAILHGIGANCPGADIVHLQTVNREKYRCLPELRPPPGLRRLLFGWYLREVYRCEGQALRDRGALFLAVSRRVGEEARRHYGVPAERIRYVPNGVDLEHYRPPSPDERAAARRALDLLEEDRVVVFVGPDHRRKGLELLLEALAGLPGVRLLSVGGNGASIARHAARAAELGLGRRATFLEQGGRVREACWAGDVFAFPSLYDPFGMAAAEALATGLPVLLSRESGVGEYLAPGEAAWIEDARDPLAIRSALAGVLDDPGWQACLREAGPRRARDFAWPRVVALVEEAYREKLAEPAQRISIASP